MIVFNYKGHLGILFMVLFALSSSGLNIWNGWFLLGCYIGTMLPDIDHNKSKLGRFFWLTTSRVHRKFTHSIVFLRYCRYAWWTI